MPGKAKTIDEYLAPLPSDQRAALQALRRTIHATVPGATECISYQLPAFRTDGRIFLWIGATAKHCAVYGVGTAHQDELAAYDTSGKGTVRFQPDAPLPVALVRKLVKARVAELAARRKSAAKSSTRRR